MVNRSKLAVLLAVIVLSINSGCSVSDPVPSGSSSQVRKPGASQTKKTYAVKRISSAKDPFDRRFLGTWVAAGSSAEFTIDAKDGLVIFSGKDLEDQEYFQVHFINWDEKLFKGSFLMPSTKHSTLVNLSVLDDKSLHCKYSGDAEGESIWWRKSLD